MSPCAQQQQQQHLEQQLHQEQQQQHHCHQYQEQEKQQQQQQQQQQHITPIFNGVNPQYPGLRQMYYDPPIFIIDNFLNENETKFLIESASDSFSASPVVGAGAGTISEARTSSSCYLAKVDVPDLMRKVAALTRKPIQHMELPQVGRYFSSQQYLPHYDAFNKNEKDGARFSSNGGQRIVTVLIYLNDVVQGGQTSFPQLGLNMQPKQGRALVFFPATVDGHLDPRALHAALPAIDTKYVSQIWIRQGN